VYTLSASTCRYLPVAGNARINPAVKQEAKRAMAVLVAASERYEQGEKEREGGGGAMVLSSINKAAGRLASFLCARGFTKRAAVNCLMGRSKKLDLLASRRAITWRLEITK
jgi:hypothetical protein